MFKLTLLVLLLGLGMASCRTLQDPVFNGIENVRLDGIGVGESLLTLDLRYFNPNGSRGRLKDAKGEAWMDNIYLGRFIVDSTIHIPSNSEFIVPVKLMVEMKNIFKNSLSAFLKQEVTIRIKGEARAGKGGIYRRFPLNYEGKQDLDKLFGKTRTARNDLSVEH